MSGQVTTLYYQFTHSSKSSSLSRLPTPQDTNHAPHPHHRLSENTQVYGFSTVNAPAMHSNIEHGDIRYGVQPSRLHRQELEGSTQVCRQEFGAQRAAETLPTRRMPPLASE